MTVTNLKVLEEMETHVKALNDIVKKYKLK